MRGLAGHLLPLPSQGTKPIALCRCCPRTPLRDFPSPEVTHQTQGTGARGSTPPRATPRCLRAAAALLLSLLQLMVQHRPGTRLPSKDTHPLYLTKVLLHLCFPTRLGEFLLINLFIYYMHAPQHVALQQRCEHAGEGRVLCAQHCPGMRGKGPHLGGTSPMGKEWPPGKR